MGAARRTRQLLPAQQAINLADFQPITITSDYAEIIYFLRNGNLYRRVLLVAPELQSSIVPTDQQSRRRIVSRQWYSTLTFLHVQPNGLAGNQVSWQGVNDLSAHPAPTGEPTAPDAPSNSIVLNTLADLTNRENRWAYPRFANDFLTT